MNVIQYRAWLAGLFVLAAAQAASAASVVGTGSGLIGDEPDDLKPVSARAIYQIVGGDLQITLSNTATGSNYTPAQVLTGIAFNLPGVTFTTAGSSVIVADGSTVYESVRGGGPPRHESIGTNGYDLSQHWGLAFHQSLENNDLGPYQFIVTASSFDDDPPRFDDFDANTDSPQLQGANYGIINAQSLDSRPIINNDIVSDSVIITLNATTDLNDSHLHTLFSEDHDLPAFKYGSAHYGYETFVPDPPSVVPVPPAAWGGMMLLAGVGGLGALRRKLRSA